MSLRQVDHWVSIFPQ